MDSVPAGTCGPGVKRYSGPCIVRNRVRRRYVSALNIVIASGTWASDLSLFRNRVSSNEFERFVSNETPSLRALIFSTVNRRAVNSAVALPPGWHAQIRGA